MCARCESKTSCSGGSKAVKFGCFFEGKKVAKGVCNVAKLATMYISISPTTGWTTGQTENTNCIFQKLLIYWGFHAPPSLGFTEFGPKKRKCPVSGSCVDEN